MGISRTVSDMHDARFLSRIRRGALPGLALVALQACGSSSTSVSSVTSPTSINRCAITMQPVEGPLPADGGSAAIAVTAARECAWSATVDGAWLSLRSGTSGQGDGTVEFAAAANPDPVMRRGAIVANGQRADSGQTLTVSRTGCSFTSIRRRQTVPATGGSVMVSVGAAASCTWTATSNAPWIAVTGGSPGSGDGAVSFNVEANTTGAPRSGTITIGGAGFTINQQ